LRLEQDSITTAFAALEAAPLSRKKAMLLVLLIDGAIDAMRADGGDVLAHREAVATAHPSLALVMELAAMREGGPRLTIESRDVPPTDEAEYMISLYNDASVSRLMIRAGDTVNEALQLLRQAVADLSGT
jgi:hypothetical protein